MEIIFAVCIVGLLGLSLSLRTSNMEKQLDDMERELKKIKAIMEKRN